MKLQLTKTQETLVHLFPASFADHEKVHKAADWNGTECIKCQELDDGEEYINIRIKRAIEEHEEKKRANHWSERY